MTEIYLPTKEKRYDLLYGENEQFRICFDMYRPRPHYMILPKVEMERDFAKLQHHNKQLLIAAAELLIKNYRVSAGIFVLHRGSWVNHRSFHAHICASVDSYMDTVHEKIAEISDWPSRMFVNKFWVANTRASTASYEENVRGYPFSSYFSDDVNLVKKLKDWGYNFGANLRSIFEHRGTQFFLTMHPSQPLIGFCCSTIQDTEKQIVLQSMENYFQQTVMAYHQRVKDSNWRIETEDDIKDMTGAHICLLLEKGNV